MKFQSKINYVQECVAVLSNAAGGEYDLARELQTDTLPEDCRKDLELLSQIQREAVEGLSKENIEFYSNRWTMQEPVWRLCWGVSMLFMHWMNWRKKRRFLIP